MLSIPYRVNITFSVGVDPLDESMNNTEINGVTLNIPTYFSSFKYFKLKVTQCSLCPYEAIDTNITSFWLMINTATYNNCISGRIPGSITIHPSSEDERDEFSDNYLFNLTAFIQSGCQDNENFQCLLPYKSTYRLSFRDELGEKIKNFKLRLMLDLVPYHI